MRMVLTSVSWPDLQRQMDEENERLLAKYERYEYLSELAEN